MPNPQPLTPIVRALSDHLPGEREREIHREVLIRGRMENVVAGQYGITVAQVQATVRRVERWLAQVQLPVPVQHTRTKHIERLEHQWREAMSAWYRSCEEEITHKTSVETRPGKQNPSAENSPCSKANTPGARSATRNPVACAGEHGNAVLEKSKAERTTRRACGDVRYLEQARKILAEIRALSTEAAAHLEEEEVHVTTLTDDQRAAEAATIIATAREQFAMEQAE